MIRVVWATDIHLEFVDDRGRREFCEQLLDAEPNFVILSGDIGTANSVERYLAEIDRTLHCPVLFVLGNHDFYEGSIREVRKRLGALARSSRTLTYLTAAGVVQLTPSVCVVGHDGWGDARLGDFDGSRLLLNDFRLIRELSAIPRPLLRERLQELGDEAAVHMGHVLPQALAKYEHVILVTHVPPFREACLHDGRPSDDDGLPFFACKALGDVTVAAACSHPGRRITVLCGHTHSAGEARVAANVLAYVGAAEYGQPRIQRMFELPVSS